MNGFNSIVRSTETPGCEPKQQDDTHAYATSMDARDRVFMWTLIYPKQYTEGRIDLSTYLDLEREDYGLQYPPSPEEKVIAASKAKLACGIEGNFMQGFMKKLAMVTDAIFLDPKNPEYYLLRVVITQEWYYKDFVASMPSKRAMERKSNYRRILDDISAALYFQTTPEKKVPLLLFQALYLYSITEIDSAIDILKEAQWMGQRVQLVKLIAKPALNGKDVIVHGLDRSTGRLIVALEGSGTKFIRVKKENVETKQKEGLWQLPKSLAIPEVLAEMEKIRDKSKR